MAKLKQFFIPVSLTENFNAVNYCSDRDESKTFTSHYPSMNMITENINEGDDYEIIALRTVDYNNIPGKNGHKSTNEKSCCNLDTLILDLKEESEKKGLKTAITVSKVIEIPYDESQDKHIKLFSDICGCYKKNSDVFVDVTYGSKPTSAALLTSLVYAEKVKGCDIREVSYGEYPHDGSQGKVFDIRCLYELNMLIQECSAIPGTNIDLLLNMFGGDE